jgi:hypothetical protein
MVALLTVWRKCNQRWRNALRFSALRLLLAEPVFGDVLVGIIFACTHCSAAGLENRYHVF